MKNKTMRDVALSAEERFGKAQAEKIALDAEKRWKQLCKENKKVCKSKKTHLFSDIFPCISYYEALQQNGVSTETALCFLDESWSRRAAKSAAATKKLLRIGRLYQKYPAMFQWVAKHRFGSRAGFAAEFYACGKEHCKFDMTQCLFLDTCTRYGYPRLTACFCHTDDINNTDLHPNIGWERPHFMGKGDTLCDFHVFVKSADGQS